MPKLIKIIALFAALSPALTWAEGAIAVLDVEGVLRNSKQAEAFREQIRKDFAPQEQQLRALSAEGNALKSRLEKEGDLMGNDARQQLMQQVQAKFVEFQQYGAQVKQQTQERERAFFEQMKPQLESIIQGLVDSRDLQLVINKKAAVFSDPELDLSPIVLQQLNK